LRVLASYEEIDTDIDPNV
jgi:hypothetical protein